MAKGGLTNRRTIAVTATAVVALLVVAAASMVRPAALHSPGRDLDLQHHTLPPQHTRSAAARGAPQVLPTAGGGDRLLGLVMFVIFVIVIAALVGTLVVSLVRVWRERRARVTAERSLPPMAEVHDHVREAAQQSMDDMQIGRPDEAIVRCWVRFERALADAGVPALRHETSSELVLRVFDNLQVPSGPLTDLAALFREARYSSHTMDEQARRRAAADLVALAKGLRDSPHAQAQDSQAAP